MIAERTFAEQEILGAFIEATQETEEGRIVTDPEAIAPNTEHGI